jgi:putative DNA primase/helicase
MLMTHDEKLKLIQANKNNPVMLAVFMLQDNPNIIRSTGGLYLYNGKCYDLLSDEQLDKMYLNFCINNEITSSWKIVTMVIRAFFAYEKIKDVAAFNTEEGLLCFNNGILNIYTKEFVAHSPDYYFDSFISVDYNAAATTCPVFLKFLNEIFNDDKETVTNIIRLGGYLLDTSCAAERMFLFDGEGSNGKSVLMNTLMLFFSKDQISPLSLDVLATNSFSKELLVKSRVNFSAEQKRASLDVEEIKKIVTGDPIEINRKFKISLCFIPKTKIIVACNGAPRFNDTTHAIYRRMLVIRFFNQYLTPLEYSQIKNPEKMNVFLKDKELFSKIKLETSAILNLFIEGLVDLRENKYEFIESNNSVVAMNDFKRSNDTIREFLEDNYEIHDTEETTLTDIFEHYRVWYKWNVQDNGTIKFRKNEMGKRLRSVFKVESTGQKYKWNEFTQRSERETMYPVRLISQPAPIEEMLGTDVEEILEEQPALNI